MSRQDKATSERFTRTLRELVKRPENKVCADCKRNGEFQYDSNELEVADDVMRYTTDPRWASWNMYVGL
jgi:stromal membrane-associated protein